MKLTSIQKTILLLVVTIASIIGFMIKLPSIFHHYDKQLHSAFYFLAAAFLNLLFAENKIAHHILIFVLLFLFGISIEYAQEYSNKLLHTRIHGRFDPEDVWANTKGLIWFSGVWVGWYLVKLLGRDNKIEE